MTELSEFAYVGVGALIFDLHLSIFLKPEMIYIHGGARIDGLVKIEGGQGVTIHPGVHISSFAHLNIGGGKLIVNANAALTSGVRIVTGSNTPAGRSMSSAAPVELQRVERDSVHIGECAFVGAGATILPGCHVGPYAIVGAGAVVTKRVEPWTVVMGTPAKIVGRRVQRANGDFGVQYFGKGEALAELMEATYP